MELINRQEVISLTSTGCLIALSYMHCNTIILAGVLLLVAVGPSNQPPQVDAGNDQMVAAGQLDELTASASDVDGSTSRYIWSQDDGDDIDSDAPDSASFSMPVKPSSETFL